MCYCRVNKIIIYNLRCFCVLGSHCKIANSAINIISSNNEDSELVNLKDVNNIILKLAPFCPLLTLEWCYLLTLLNYNDSSFWSMILRSPKCDRIVHLS